MTFFSIYHCSILFSRWNVLNLTRTAHGAAVPWPTLPPLSCWSTVKALMSPVCTGISLILGHSATVYMKNSITPPVVAKVKAVRWVDIFSEHLQLAAMHGGALPGPLCHWARTPWRTMRDIKEACHTSQLSTATMVRMKTWVFRQNYIWSINLPKLPKSFGLICQHIILLAHSIQCWCSLTCTLSRAPNRLISACWKMCE